MKKWTIQAAVILLGIMFQANAANAEGYIYGKNEIDLSYEKECYLQQESPDWEMMKKRLKVKGIYMTGYTVAMTERFNKLIDLVKTTELNAVVIDVKDDNGLMTYSSDLPDVGFTGANKKVRIKDIDAVMKILRDNNIYSIARIVTFKDRIAGDKYANLAVKNTSGGIWRDRHGMS